MATDETVKPVSEWQGSAELYEGFPHVAAPRAFRFFVHVKMSGAGFRVRLAIVHYHHAAIGEDLQGVANVSFRLVPFVESIDKNDVEAFLVRSEEFVRCHLEGGVSFLAWVYTCLSFAIYSPESLASGGPDFKEAIVFSRLDEGVY
jgi:hypothetical protein